MKKQLILSVVAFSGGAFFGTALAEYPPASVATEHAGRGLIVLLGGETTESLDLAEEVVGRNRGLVQCLATDDKHMEGMRTAIQGRGLSGKVTVRKIKGEYLPYANNMVNTLIVGDGQRTLDPGEIQRVLTPAGVALAENRVLASLDVEHLIQSNARVDGWVKLTKPRPDTMDSWTHYLYDAGGGAASKDKEVGFPQHVQWETGPRWSRSHENMSSVTAVVTAGGRIFSIIDEGPRASIYLPSRISLIARDAFNGILLWKQPIETWHSHLFRLKSGPHQLARRLVATDEKVYVTLGLGAPISVMDAATGTVERTVPGSENAEEILLAGQKLVIRASQDANGTSSVVVFDVDSGKELWSSGSRKWTPLTLSSDGRHVYCHAVDRLYCMDILSGSIVWQTSVDGPIGRFMTNAGPGITLYKDVVVFASKQGITVLDARTGGQLWQQQSRVSDYRSPTRIFVINDLVWKVANKGWEANDWNNAHKKTAGVFVGYDYRTGEIKQRIGIDGSRGEGIIHHRCYIPKAVDKHILTSWPGIEFVDTEGGTITPHNWIRGACLYGILPANGMIYVPAHPCVCYNQGKLNGFYAVTSRQTQTAWKLRGDRLEEGPGYRRLTTNQPPTQTADEADWPTYRGNNSRSGYSTTVLSASLSARWKTSLGSRLTAPVIAGHTVYVADRDAHTIHAIDAETGNRLWHFLADGAVDSPPSYYRGSLYFGCRDGYVYSLDAEEGTLQWRFLAAMEDRQIVSYDRLESQWPLHGSVTIDSGKLYVVAGRNAFMDRGMDLYCLDPRTGRQLWVKRLFSLDKDGRQPALAGNATDRLSMNTIAPDIMSSDGQYLYLRHKTYEIGDLKEATGKTHLYSAMGFLDQDFFHRAFWVYDDGTVGRRYAWQFGKNQSGKPPFGSRLAVKDAAHVYHFGRKMAVMGHHKQGEQFYLACFAADGERQQRWMTPVSMLVRVMSLAGDRLYIAGPHGNWQSDIDVFEGNEKIVFRTYNTKDGSLIAEQRLNALPCFDGMAIACGRLYICLEDGSVVCWE